MDELISNIIKVYGSYMELYFHSVGLIPMLSSLPKDLEEAFSSI